MPAASTGDAPSDAHTRVPSTAESAPAPRLSVRARIGWFSAAGFLLAADLWSKHLVFYPHVLEPGFREGEVVGRIASWWQTKLVYNLGVTFGMFEDVPAWTKALLTTAVIAWLGFTLWRLPAGRPVQAASLAMIVGGAVGNLYDRTLRPLVEPDTRPGVRDFLDWYAPDDWRLAGWLREHDVHTHWYTSNIADVLIVCGVILLAGCLLREPGERRPGRGPAPDPGPEAAA